VNYCYLKFGLEVTVEMLDEIKSLGFLYATKSACRSASTTWSSRQQEEAGRATRRKLEVSIQQQYLDGAITNGERYNKVIAIWSGVTEKVADEMFSEP
jgi:DNA-directed RNA polymerase subunit beta'